jgi:hypothetical protein
VGFATAVAHQKIFPMEASDMGGFVRDRRFTASTKMDGFGESDIAFEAAIQHFQMKHDNVSALDGLVSGLPALALALNTAIALGSKTNLLVM